MGVGIFRRPPRYAPTRRDKRRRFITAPTPPGTVSLTTPVAHQLFQREGIGAGGGKADIPIVGTYTGTPTAIEASFNGGAYATVVASPSGGTFSTKLPRQSVGAGTLTVRFTNDTGISTTVANVKVGDLYIVDGQSNADGRGTSNQSYSGTAGWASKFYSAWAELTDPTGNTGSSAGSCWPLLANSIVGTGAVPVAFINLAIGGTSITTHLESGGDFNDIKTYLANSGNRICRAVLWWQGETDAIAAMSQATYYGHLQALAESCRDELGAKLIPCKLQNSSGIADVDEARILAAIGQAWEQDQYTETGPDFSDLASDDSFHLQSNGNLATAATRWYAILEPLYYVASAGGSGGGRQGLHAIESGAV